MVVFLRDGAGSKWLPVYIRHRSSSMKSKANECKLLITISIGYCIVKSTVLVQLTIIKFKKTMRESLDFVHFLFSIFLPLLIIERSVCANIIHTCTKWLLYYQAFSFSGLGQHTSYDWRATAMKLSVTVSKDAPHAWSSTSGASVELFRAWNV